MNILAFGLGHVVLILFFIFIILIDYFLIIIDYFFLIAILIMSMKFCQSLIIFSLIKRLINVDAKYPTDLASTDPIVKILPYSGEIALCSGGFLSFSCSVQDPFGRLTEGLLTFYFWFLVSKFLYIIPVFAKI